jgi:hypothetical protein
MTDTGIKVAKSHTLGLEQLAIIASHAERTGLNESAALRQIISEWKDAQRTPEPDAALAGPARDGEE